jgi:PPK2 family polyphosphate:nucleotide phosphotransferase
MSRFAKLVKPFRITNGKGFKLSNHDPADTNGFKDKDAAAELLADSVERLSALQDRLYADERWSLLLIFQAMDAAGKDGTIKHVMSGVNPQGCQVFSFKAPSAEEMRHDFLWRTTRCLPERGRIGIFNRSYYEETLVVRVHPELLNRQKVPSSLVTDRVWDERFESINDLERHLSRSGTVVRKFFLNISQEEQKRRFLKRIEDQDRNWKFSSADSAERSHWDDYMHAYQEMIRATASEHAPWHVIPADHKWFTRLVVAAAIVDTLESLDLAYPTVDDAKRRELAKAKRMLQRG